MISGIFTGIVVVLFLVLLFNLRAFKQLFGVGKAQAGKLARAAEQIDPVAMYQEKIDEATEKLRTSKEGLVRVKGLIAGVERQVAEGRTETARLDARIKLALHDGNETKAAEYVSQLQRAKKDLTNNESQLKEHTASYQSFLKEVQSSQSKIISARRDAEKLGTQLEISKATAEISEINKRFSAKADPLDEATRYREGIQKQIDQNKARGQVSNDVNSDLVQEEAEDEKLRQMEARSLLEQYKKDLENQPIATETKKDVP